MLCIVVGNWLSENYVFFYASVDRLNFVTIL